MELYGKTINFLGDSITEGTGVDRKEDIYLNVLAKKVGFTANNYGVGGTRIAKNRSITTHAPQFDLDFILRAQDMTDQADLIIIFGGTNDYGHGDAPFGKLDDQDPYTFCGAVNVLLDLIENKYPNKPIVFMTPIHRTEEEKPINEVGIRNVATLKDYVEAIKAVCKKHNVPVFDSYNLVEINPNLQSHKEEFCPDGLHPNAKGHQIIADKLLQFLNDL